MGIFYSHEETYEEHLKKKYREFVETVPDITKWRERECIAKGIPPFKGWETDS